MDDRKPDRRAFVPLQAADPSSRSELTGTVFVVDDDPAVREALEVLVSVSGYPVRSFAHAEEFLASPVLNEPGCLILDLRMPGMNGLELQRELLLRHNPLPIIVLSAHADLSAAVQSMRAGAVDFIQKPFSGMELMDRVREALRLNAEWRAALQERELIESRLALLTTREREVLNMMVDGVPTKVIARRLGSSFYTVQNQRSSILRKLKADSVVNLVGMLLKLRQDPRGIAGRQLPPP
jgi:FixJ family two-component response regulator